MFRSTISNINRRIKNYKQLFKHNLTIFYRLCLDNKKYIHYLDNKFHYNVCLSIYLFTYSNAVETE